MEIQEVIPCTRVRRGSGAAVGSTRTSGHKKPSRRRQECRKPRLSLDGVRVLSLSRQDWLAKMPERTANAAKTNDDRARPVSMQSKKVYG